MDHTTLPTKSAGESIGADDWNALAHASVERRMNDAINWVWNGTTWAPSYGYPYPLRTYAVYNIGTTYYCGVGECGLIYLYESGADAYTLTSAPGELTAKHWFGCDLVSTTVWACGEDGVVGYGVAVPSALATSAGSDNLYGIAAITTSNIWVVGRNGAIYESTNAGVTWTAIDPGWGTDAMGRRRHLYGIWAGSINDVWIVGGGGLLLHYDASADEGERWTRYTAPVKTVYRAIWGVASDDVWVVGDRRGGHGTIIHWDGVEWTDKSTALSAPDYDWWSVHAIAGGHFVVGADGQVWAHNEGVRDTVQGADNAEAVWIKSTSEARAFGTQEESVHEIDPGDPGSLHVIERIRATIEAVLDDGDYVDETTIGTPPPTVWTLATILDHLGIGSGTPTGWTDPTLTAGMALTLTHYNEPAAVLSEMIYATAGVSAASYHRTAIAATEAQAYADSAAAAVLTGTNYRVGHTVISSPPDYAATRYRENLTVDAREWPPYHCSGDSPGDSLSYLAVQLGAEVGGRDFDGWVWPAPALGTWDGDGASFRLPAPPSDGTWCVITLGGSDLPQGDVDYRYFVVAASRESTTVGVSDTSDRPTLGDNEYAELNSTGYIALHCGHLRYR